MNDRPRIAILDALFSDVLEVVQEQYPDLAISMASEDLKATVASTDVLVTQKVPVTADLLDAAGDLRLLLKMGRVYENIDVEAARQLSLPMALTPRKGPNCVAELALTLMLALSKELLQSHGHVAAGDYQQLGLEPELTEEHKYAFKWMKQDIQEIRGRTLGLVGMGEVGCELSRRARVMDMDVLYTKRTPLSPEVERRYDVVYSDLHALLEASDYVCLAVPHTSQTEGMIGAEELRLIGPQSFLINIARGRIVDENALVQALQTGNIAGAGLDVFAYEPLPHDSPLALLENVILTPHIGGGSGSNPTLELGEALAEVESILAGNAPREVI